MQCIRKSQKLRKKKKMHNLVAIAYVISGILFITALRGLSSPESSRRGNVFGIVGMIIAVFATLVSVDFFIADKLTMSLVILAIVIGAFIGATIAKKIAMTAMPQLICCIS